MSDFVLGSSTTALLLGVVAFDPLRRGIWVGEAPKSDAGEAPSTNKEQNLTPAKLPADALAHAFGRVPGGRRSRVIRSNPKHE